MFRGSFLAFLLGLVMFAACITSFGLDAPTAAGALFLAAMVACGVTGLLLAAREAARMKAAARSVQRQRAREREPWDA
jgi:hypothetical protein